MDSEVSILAPAQGASVKSRSNEAYERVSILAPAQGAWDDGCAHDPARKVSILAPAQGACKFERGVKYLKQFQFSPPHRGHRRDAV